jgi:hypothetical protein
VKKATDHVTRRHMTFLLICMENMFLRHFGAKGIYRGVSHFRKIGSLHIIGVRDPQGFSLSKADGCMARDGHGLPKVSSRLAMSYLSTSCRWASPETALPPFQGWPACRAGCLRPSSTSLDTPSRTTMSTARASLNRRRLIS